jgi:hypothetical protein
MAFFTSGRATAAGVAILLIMPSNPQSLLGKILRLDVESTPDLGFAPIPTNPFTFVDRQPNLGPAYATLALLI